MQDFAYFKSLYPAACKQMQLCVEAVCDELEYEGSPIYDEYPDRIFLEKLTKRALEKWQKVYPAGTERTDTLTTYMKAADVGTVSTEEGTAMVENSLKIDSPGGEREENLAGTSIQPHLPGNDVWYGPLRGEQKGGNAGYMVWEADEPNLTAQERRPWSPPPGPRPGGPGNPCILKEVRSGEMSRHDVFSCMTLMGLAHAIIEDTCLMLLIGAHIGGIFFLRLALAFVTCAVINILYLRFRGDAREPETAPNEVS